MPQYRNEFATVEEVSRDYPGLIGADSGGFVDQVAHRLNRRDGEVRWGRKARNSDGSNPNHDALAYLNNPADRAGKVLIDIIIASGTAAAAPSWQEYVGDNLGNGFWTPPISPDRDAPGPEPQPKPPGDLGTALSEIRAQLAALDVKIDSVKTGLEAHGDANVRMLAERFEQVRRDLETTLKAWLPKLGVTPSRETP